MYLEKIAKTNISLEATLSDFTHLGILKGKQQ
jgi:hypothetical protein